MGGSRVGGSSSCRRSAALDRSPRFFKAAPAWREPALGRATRAQLSLWPGMNKGGPASRSPSSRAALLLLGGALAMWLTQHSCTGAGSVALDASGCPNISDMAAEAALHALQQAAQREQAAWCAAHSDLSAGAEGYTRATARVPGNENTTFPMWLLAQQDTVSVYIGRQGFWESGETRAFLTHLATFAQAHGLQPEQTYMLDIGANLGWHGLVAALMGYRVLAFEPMEGNLGALWRTLGETPALQQRYTLVPMGLSDARQRCAFFTARQNSGNGFTACGDTANVAARDNLKVNAWGKLVKVGEFELDRLDGVLGAASRALRRRIGLIKIDVEGHEEKVIVYQGAVCFLRSAQPEFIFAEVNGPALELSAGRTTPEGMLQLYDELGYDIRRGGFGAPVQRTSSFSQLVKESQAFRMDANFFLTQRRQARPEG
ncbi:hypothetical protein ABPG75_012444 [Micractinium tetrahymenae]